MRSAADPVIADAGQSARRALGDPARLGRQPLEGEVVEHDRIAVGGELDVALDREAAGDRRIGAQTPYSR